MVRHRPSEELGGAKPPVEALTQVATSQTQPARGVVSRHNNTRTFTTMELVAYGWYNLKIINHKDIFTLLKCSCQELVRRIPGLSAAKFAPITDVEMACEAFKGFFEPNTANYIRRKAAFTPLDSAVVTRYNYP